MYAVSIKISVLIKNTVSKCHWGTQLKEIKITIEYNQLKTTAQPQKHKRTGVCPRFQMAKSKINLFYLVLTASAVTLKRNECGCTCTNVWHFVITALALEGPPPPSIFLRPVMLLSFYTGDHPWNLLTDTSLQVLAHFTYYDPILWHETWNFWKGQKNKSFEEQPLLVWVLYCHTHPPQTE